MKGDEQRIELRVELMEGQQFLVLDRSWDWTAEWDALFRSWP